MSRLGSLPPRDLERLSAYLDGDLPPREAENLRARLVTEPELRQALDELKQVVSAVRGLPEIRVPRNFTLRPADVARPTAAYSYLRFATVLATALFVLTTALRTLSGISFPMGAAAPVAQIAVEGQQEMFRDVAGTSEPTTEAAVALEADEAPPAAPATQTPADTIVTTPAQGAAGIPSPAPTATSSAPSLAFGAETGALPLEGPADETAGADALRAAQVAPPADPLVVAQWILAAGVLLLAVLTVLSRRRR